MKLMVVMAIAMAMMLHTQYLWWFLLIDLHK